MASKKFCDFCDREIHAKCYGVLLFQQSNDKDIEDLDACTDCKNAVVRALKFLKKRRNLGTGRGLNVAHAR